MLKELMCVVVGGRRDLYHEGSEGRKTYARGYEL